MAAWPLTPASSRGRSAQVTKKEEDLSIYEKMSDLEYSALPLEVNDHIVRQYLKCAARSAIDGTPLDQQMSQRSRYGAKPKRCTSRSDQT